MLSINIKYTTPENHDVSRIFTADEVTIFERVDIIPTEYASDKEVECLGIFDVDKEIKVAVVKFGETSILVGDGNIYVMNDKGSTIDRFAVWQYNKPI